MSPERTALHQYGLGAARMAWNPTVGTGRENLHIIETSNLIRCL